MAEPMGGLQHAHPFIHDAGAGPAGALRRQDQSVMRDMPRLINRRDHFGPGPGSRIGGDGEVEDECRAGTDRPSHTGRRRLPPDAGVAARLTAARLRDPGAGGPASCESVPSRPISGGGGGPAAMLRLDPPSGFFWRTLNDSSVTGRNFQAWTSSGPAGWSTPFVTMASTLTCSAAA